MLKRGIYIERAGYHDSKRLAKYVKQEEVTNWHIKCQEFSHRVIMPELSRRAGKIIDKETVIFDCEGMGFHQLHLPSLTLYRAIAELDQKYYPERLGKLFVILRKFYLNILTLKIFPRFSAERARVLICQVDAFRLRFSFMRSHCANSGEDSNIGKNNVEISFRVVEGKGGVKFGVKFIKADSKTRYEEKIIMSPTLMLDDDSIMTHKHAFQTDDTVHYV
ncbi:unnamed protein product [Rhizophagus irregularis]|nr:unnamed protein product [Rhizophagus irregularis]